jgi:cellulose synthase/poly-beta-1,6-N-acetylglucosamine synthase-like glycosyltransferase
MITLAIAALCCLIWLYLIGARGKFWRIAPAAAPTLGFASAPRVAVIVPARNEADLIGQTIQSLLAQDYPGPLHIFVVDDQSSDQTAAVVRDAAAEHGERLTIMLPFLCLPVGPERCGPLLKVCKRPPHPLQTISSSLTRTLCMLRKAFLQWWH